MEIREPAATAQAGSATVPRPLTTGRADTADKTGGASTGNVPKNHPGGSDVVDLSAVGQKNGSPVESGQVPAGTGGLAEKSVVAGQSGKPESTPQRSNAGQGDSAQVGFNSDNTSSRRDYALDQGDLVVKIVTNGEVVREIPTEDQRKIKQAIKKYVSQSSPQNTSGNEQSDTTAVESAVNKAPRNTGDTGAAQSAQAGTAKTDSDGDNDPSSEAGEGKEQNKVADIVS